MLLVYHTERPEFIEAAWVTTRCDRPSAAANFFNFKWFATKFRRNCCCTLIFGVAEFPCDTMYDRSHVENELDPFSHFDAVLACYLSQEDTEP